MLKNKTPTYVSLFSSAGVGCYGFKMEGFECIATCELLEKRLNVQKINKKCHFKSGYILGDLTQANTKQLVYNEIRKWDRQGNDRVDVVIATPPCQGISVVNHKKNSSDVKRNSLVIESIEMVKAIQPRFFVFENVMAFEKTLCISHDNQPHKIGDFIREYLGEDYVISSRILNFMNYGSNSSRTRTLVIGVNKSYKNTLGPLELFPNYRKEPTLRDVIFGFPPLEWGEICPTDFYHAFRTYDPKMRPWIHALGEGECAFDNPNPLLRPHRVIDGKVVQNVEKNRDKYTRQRWDRFVQCVQTRNDQLAAQNTIHPVEDRVFSVREIMTMMTVPASFRWVDYSLEELNALSLTDKKKLYSDNENNIRECLGEAVPTEIMRQIAASIKKELFADESRDLKNIIADNQLNDRAKLIAFLTNNPLKLSVSSLTRITEACNSKRNETAAYYTNRFLVNEIVSSLPEFSGERMKILEPSVGAGNFLPLLFKKYGYVPRVELTLVDIDPEAIETLRILMGKMAIPSNFVIRIACSDFLTLRFGNRFDLIVGNPPFGAFDTGAYEGSDLVKQNENKETNDLSEYFLEKCLNMGDYVALVLNKTFLSTPEFAQTREMLKRYHLDKVIDFNRFGFSGVSIETMCLCIDTVGHGEFTSVISLKFNKRITQKQSYITDPAFPYFLIYRDSRFDSIVQSMAFNVFNVFRDRQITKQNTSKTAAKDSVWVLKGRNLKEDGSGIIHIPDYDSYISESLSSKITAFKYLDDRSVYLTPNMTYLPRVFRNTVHCVPDGSVAVLIPKNPALHITDDQLKYFCSDDFRYMYRIARNLSTQSINIDKTSVFFFGIHYAR